MEQHLAAIARLADERALAIQELLDRGLTRAEVARRLGVTPAVITKILKRPVVATPPPWPATGSVRRSVQRQP
ncbi:MAG: helix-turn-helix domain-containing protein [Acidimicrobiia bacterium]